MTNQKRITVQEVENQAAHRRQIELIFARACAESLKESVGFILRDDLKEEKARAHGEAFASAFVFMSRYFTSEAAASLQDEIASRQDNSRSTPEAASQASESSLCPELLSLLKTQKSTQERIDQLLAR
ncbi:hypothetical protein KUU03_11155 [Pseudomonas aeruginosa]|uniref:hypothetical protein n=1 Tax=Pseudomonas aeruginosa TaxID=287 RepID=UPI000F542830|nr:hypothetical protein [Pseudomonas aeruginosa]EKD1543205.1 hypothetical protein [Pseudomonas aeruginosa]EKV8095865.1 hypothetical protein [Pseudomonas aeruginosa]EKW6727553.1 hypothetical protein [Pseudomonas aeruginosa]MBV5882861.1 hypothetical protein [Pseudomonas aeruginosa]MDI4120955.1 hypothetical protein [Pseudomonas aeruginosa]